MSCKKRRFTQKGAERALLQAKIAKALRGSTTRNEKRVYPCPECNPPMQWHLSSKESRNGLV